VDGDYNVRANNAGFEVPCPGWKGLISMAYRPAENAFTVTANRHVGDRATLPGPGIPTGGLKFFADKSVSYSAHPLAATGYCFRKKQYIHILTVSSKKRFCIGV